MEIVVSESVDGTAVVRAYGVFFVSNDLAGLRKAGARLDGAGIQIDFRNFVEDAFDAGCSRRECAARVRAIGGESNAAMRFVRHVYDLRESGRARITLGLPIARDP